MSDSFMTFLHLLAAIAIAYVAGGLFTTIAFAIILWRDSGNINLGGLMFLPKVFVLWPAAIGMAAVFGVIMVAQRWHFAQEAKKAATKNHNGPVA